MRLVPRPAARVPGCRDEWGVRLVGVRGDLELIGHLGVAFVVLRIVQGVLVTRWLFNSLGKEYYGFWSLIWMILVYALLLDFGFSKAAQKYTATGLFKSDPDAYNRYLSAVFSLLSLMATAIVAGSSRFGISPSPPSDSLSMPTSVSGTRSRANSKTSSPSRRPRRRRWLTTTIPRLCNSGRLTFNAAGFMATSTNGSSPGVVIS